MNVEDTLELLWIRWEQEREIVEAQDEETFRKEWNQYLDEYYNCEGK